MTDQRPLTQLREPASFFTLRASFQQLNRPESTRTDPFASRRTATRPSRLQAERWRRRWA